MTLKLINHGLPTEYLPRRAHSNDVGADVYALRDYTVEPNETLRIPLGFGVEIPIGYAGFIYPRSGTAAAGVLMHLPPIDPGYTGEVHAVITNLNSSNLNIHKGHRIGQLVVMPAVTPAFAFETDIGERKDGNFGHTGGAIHNDI